MKTEINKEVELIKTLKDNKGRGINCILNIASKILGNPLIMNDTTYRLLAYTENTVKDDLLWNELIELGTFSHETVNFFSKERFIADVANTDIITVLKSKKLKYDRANAKIFDKNNNHIANICVVACYRPFKPSDFKNIETICKALSAEIQTSEYYQQNERIFTESFVSGLIDGYQINKSNLEKNMTELYSGLQSNLYVAVLDITQYEHTLTHLNYFRDLFGKIAGEFKYFIHLNNIVAIISTQSPALNINTDLKKIGKFCFDNNIFIGLSSSFQNLLELEKYYKQALNALNYGLSINSYNNNHIFEYDNYRLNCFLTTMHEHINIKDLCHSLIFALTDYDEVHNTNYYNFLYNYFLVGRNQHLAARNLKMKLSDFRQELDFITSTFAIDWNNGDFLGSMYISMRIAQNLLEN